MVDPLEPATRHFAARGEPAWLVGGRVRDALLGRPGVDTDIVVQSGALDHARAIARAEGAAFVPLDRRRGYARVVWPNGARVALDITDMAGDSLEADLVARDFTINALAVPLGTPLPPDPSQIVDPTGGLSDLAARRLRAPTPAAFDADPLRLLRGVRLAATLGMALDDATRAAIASRAPLAARPAGERVRDELAKMLATDAPGDVVADLHRLGLLAVLLPGAEHGAALAVPALAAMAVWRGRHGDVRMPLAPEGRFDAGSRAVGHVPEVWTRLALILAAGALTAPGVPPRPARRARMAVDAAAVRLRLGCAEAEHVHVTARLAAAICDPIGGQRLSRRAVYRAFRLGGEGAVDAAVVALAIAASGGIPTAATTSTAGSGQAARDPEKATSAPERSARVAATTTAWLDAWFTHREEWIEPRPFLDGRALMAALDLAPGPLVGRLLAGLREAQALGDVSTLGEAEAWARRRLVGYG